MEHISTSMKTETILLSRTPGAAGAKVAQRRGGQERGSSPPVREKSLRMGGVWALGAEHGRVARS